MGINKDIFRNYDIRGVYKSTLFDKDAYLIGRAFGLRLKKLGKNNCAVGHDNRLSSSSLYENYKRGLLDSGIDVVELGECLTPLVKFYVYHKKLDAGTSVTASHNPPEYNGFKMMLENGKALYGDDIKSLYEEILNMGSVYSKDFVDDGHNWSGGHSITESSSMGNIIDGSDLFGLYAKFLAERFDFKGKGIKIALNCGNGTASNFAPKILRDLGVEVVEINCISDGSFPNGAPDPERPDFMMSLKEKVIKEGCLLGIGLDGDSDRFGVVDEQGFHYQSDKIMMLLSKYFLSLYPNSLICCDVKCSLALVNLINELGGQSKMIKTGYPYHILEAQNEAVFSGELSGHLFFGVKANFYGLDDGIVSTCVLLKVYGELADLKEGQKALPFSSLMNDFPKLYHTAEIKIACADDKKFEVMENLILETKKVLSEENVITIDGIRGSVSKLGWFLLRASNTSPYIVGRVEGGTASEVENIKQLVAGILEKVGLSAQSLMEAQFYYS